MALERPKAYKQTTEAVPLNNLKIHDCFPPSCHQLSFHEMIERLFVPMSKAQMEGQTGAGKRTALMNFPAQSKRIRLLPGKWLHWGQEGAYVRPTAFLETHKRFSRQMDI